MGSVVMKLKVDSRKVIPGDTFLALRGVDSDGHQYIEKAIENGAIKIIAEEGSYAVETEIVPDTRAYLATYLKDYYHDMLSKLQLIGITGTNGKTTSAFLLHKAFYQVGIKAAYIGTVGFYMDEKVRSLNNTTPDLYELYALFEEAYKQGCKIIVMEVSSQGIAYGRIEGLEFDLAIFTNLTQDHLDFHKSMGNYALAKQQLFKQLKKDGLALINADDSYKEYFLLDQNINVTYGFTNSDYQVIDYQMTNIDTVFTCRYHDELYTFDMSLLGKYNVYNALVTIAALHEYGVSFDKIRSIFPHLSAPVGRMDMVRYQTNTIIVDYAHTPDAIEKILRTVGEVEPEHIYVVFGCTGDRDRLKRPIMMELVTNLADYAIITNDDPHDEDPKQIVADMIDGIEKENFEVILDRPKAIAKGISLLKSHDVLLILGKGHEEFMIVKDKKIPMNDKKIVEDLLKEYQR